MPSPADRVSREEIEAAMQALAMLSNYHTDPETPFDGSETDWLETLAETSLSAAASVRQEPDWEGVARKAVDLLRRLGEWDQMQVAAQPGGYGDGRYWLGEIERVREAFERAAGEGENE